MAKICMTEKELNLIVEASASTDYHGPEALIMIWEGGNTKLFRQVLKQIYRQKWNFCAEMAYYAFTDEDILYEVLTLTPEKYDWGRLYETIENSIEANEPETKEEFDKLFQPAINAAERVGKLNIVKKLEKMRREYVS